MSDEQMTKYYNQLLKVDPKLAAEFAATGKLPDASVLEGYSDYTDKYINYDAFIGDKYKTLASFYQSQDGKMPSEARMLSFQKQHPDISAQEVTDWFNKTNKYKADIETERKAEAGRKRRAKEIEEEWGPVQKMLASEYSKQRYIEEPEASLFGKEGKEGRWWQRGEDISDVTFGAAGAVGDLVPGVGSVVLGPAARGARDVYHVATNSKYQKEPDQIAKGIAWDAGMNAGVNYLPTAILNRGAKAGRNISKTDSFLRDVSEVYTANQSKQSVSKSLESLNNDVMYGGLSYRGLEKKVRDLPEGPMKQDLMAMIQREAPYDEISAHIAHWEGVAGDVPATAYYNAAGDINKAKAGRWADTPVQGYVKEQAQAAGASKAAKNVANVADILRKGGEPAVRESYTYSGRGEEPKRKQTPLERKLYNQQIDWYKKNYVRDWEAGFAPKEIEGDPLWEAYKEWKEGK